MERRHKFFSEVGVHCLQRSLKQVAHVSWEEMDHPCSAPCLHPVKLGSADTQTKPCKLSQHGRVQLKAVLGPWKCTPRAPNHRRALGAPQDGRPPRAGALHFDDLRHPRDLPHGHQEVQAVALVEEQRVSLRLAPGESQQGLHRLPHLQRHRPHLKQSQTKPNPNRSGRLPAVPVRAPAAPSLRPWLPRRHVWPPPSGAWRGPAAPSVPRGSGSGRGLAAGGQRGRAWLGAVSPGGGFASGRAAPARPAQKVRAGRPRLPPVGFLRPPGELPLCQLWFACPCPHGTQDSCHSPVRRCTAACRELPAGSTFSRSCPACCLPLPRPS